MVEIEARAVVQLSEGWGFDPWPQHLPNNGNSPPNKQRARGKTGNPTPNKSDTILIGDFLTKYVRMAKNENLSIDDTFVRGVRTGLLPVILSTHPNNRKIMIQAGSCHTFLQRKVGSEVLKKYFCLLLEKRSDCHCISS